MSRIKAFAASLLLLAAIAAAPAMARPRATPTPAPTPTPVEDPAITKLARQQFVAWQIGSIDKKIYNEQLLPKLTDAKVADVSRHIAPLGALNGLSYVGPFSGADFPDGAHGYIYQMFCTQGKIYEWLIVDSAGKIASIFFRDTLTTEDITAPAPSPT